MKRGLFLAFFFISSFLGFSQPGAALNFDGTNDYVNLPNSGAPFDVSSSHVKTFQLWFKNTANQGAHVRIFSTGTANWTTGIWFGYAAGSPYLRFELCDGIIYPGVAITGTTNIRGDNQWHQATGVINGSVATLYLDAIYEGSVSISTIGAMNSAGAVHIGNSYDNESSSYFRGDIDELRVWEKALCQPEIMSTMNCELTGSEAGLVAYYQFNQGTAAGNNAGLINLPDLTFNSNNGILTNMGLNGVTSNWVSPGGVITGSVCPPPPQCQSTGINQYSVNNSIKISSEGNQFFLYSESADFLEISVFDLTGKSILKNSALHQNSFKIDLNSFNSGLYFITAKLSNAETKTFKVFNQ